LALDRTSFMGAQLQGAILAGVRGTYTALIEAQLVQADLRDAAFEMSDAGKADFSGVQADGIRWNKSVLQSTVWHRASLKKAQLIYCDLSHADFSDADCSQANLDGANVHAIQQKNTRWDGAQLNAVRPTDAALERAEQWQAR